MQADIFCTNSVLYQGTITQHFISDGKLTGIFLNNPRRFDRELYLADRAVWEKANDKSKPKPDKENYWRAIPSENLYFFVDKIFNMNLNYRSPGGHIAADEAVRKLVIEIVGQSLQAKNITITQTRIPSSSSNKKLE